MKKKKLKPENLACNFVAKYAVLFNRVVIYKDKKKDYSRNVKHKKDDYFQLVF